jgi:short-subunit dehydrogenase
VKNLKYSRVLTRSAERVAAEGYRGLQEGRRVVVPGFANRVVTVLGRIMPRRWLLEMSDSHNRNRA